MANRLMVVDDSLVIRNRIARLCADARLPALEVVGVAADGEEAVRIAGERMPSLVTMDLTMPAMNGGECIERLVGMLPDVRILVVSALSDKLTALGAIRKGAQGFLHKPFTDDQLVESLMELMA